MWSQKNVFVDVAADPQSVIYFTSCIHDTTPHKESVFLVLCKVHHSLRCAGLVGLSDCRATPIKGRFSCFTVWLSGNSLRDRVRSWVIQEGLRVEMLILHIEKNQMRWFGHLVRVMPALEGFKHVQLGGGSWARLRSHWRDDVIGLGLMFFLEQGGLGLCASAPAPITRIQVGGWMDGWMGGWME